MNKMIALFIGRFQPFHNGHLEIIKNIKDKYEKIIIGIGSSQNGNNIINPFTVEERKLMIQKTLKLYKINNYNIVKIPDINNYPKWVSHVKNIVPDFDAVITNNPITKSLFKKKGYLIVKTKFYNRKEFSGENIRKKILLDENWENSIPKPVYNIIKKINGIDRIKKLNK